MEIDELVKAVQTLNAEDAFRARLTLDNWRTIAPYLARYDIRAGDLLIKQGDADRSMYFLEQGSCRSSCPAATGQQQDRDPARRRHRRRAGAVRRHAAHGQRRSDDAMRCLGAARPAAGRARAALARARARAAARRRRRHGDAHARTLAKHSAGDLSGRRVRPAPAAPLLARASGSGDPERTSVSPAASADRIARLQRRAPVAGAATRPCTPRSCERLLAERAACAARRRRQGDAGSRACVELLDGVVVGAVEVAAQQAVARVALLAARGGSRAASARPPAPARGLPASASPRSLPARPRSRPRRAALEVGVVDGAHDHRHLRRVRLHEVQHLQRRGRVVIADHDRAGARQAGGHQALQARGVAEDDALAGRRSLAHAVGVEVERDVADASRRRACAPGSGRSGRSRR